jgi:acyl-CoA dehydrogenase
LSSVVDTDFPSVAAFEPAPSLRSAEIAARTLHFVATVVAPFERDPRNGTHGPSDELVAELRAKAREAGLMTPHLLCDGEHLTQRETAAVLRSSGFSPLGPVALNVMAPDEGNMYLLARVATPSQKARFLDPLRRGESRSAFFMTEPANEQGAGSDPSMLKTTARRVDDGWLLSGRKAFITGAAGAGVGIIMAKTGQGATLFLVDLPNPAVRIERILDTIDSSMPGGHAIALIDALKIPPDQVLGAVDEGFRYAQVRLSPARLSHCMRWLGGCARAHEIAVDYACSRKAFGKQLIEHEAVGFMLVDNLIDLKQAELLIDWCAGILDAGSLATMESSMTKAAVSEALFRVADRCVQVMGGSGVAGDSIVQQMFRELRAFRIYDGPTEVHKWSLAKRIARSRGGSER